MEKIQKFIEKINDLQYINLITNFFIGNFIFYCVFFVLNKYIPFEKEVTEILNSVPQLLLFFYLIIVGPLTVFKFLVNVEMASRINDTKNIKHFRETLILAYILGVVCLTFVTKSLLSSGNNSILPYVSLLILLFILILYHFFGLIYDAITKEIGSASERKNFFLSVIAIIVTVVALLK